MTPGSAPRNPPRPAPAEPFANYGNAPKQIYALLRHRILRGELPGGAKIKIGAVAGELGVSPIPVREAIRMLAADGLIDVQPRHSPVVLGVTLAEIYEIGEIRRWLEPFALSLAVPQLEEATLSACQDLIDRSRDTTDGWDKVQFNRSFHLSLYRPCGRGRLLKIIEDQLDGTIRFSRYLVVADELATQAEEDEHQVILDACRRRDAEEATAALTHHLERALERLTQVWSTIDAG
ncbi:MAG: GntR family transcriptional regulator [Rhodospirillaceae bacterium]|nr:GntR family transcriptional regulator [Rhodospirillaceae bacterium]MCA8931741.1 GntR family transcriptional regulator [Rhodospirillaceae bacterium]